MDKKTLIKKQFIKMYLDYVNNFLTVEAFADHYSMTERYALWVLKIGKRFHSFWKYKKQRETIKMIEHMFDVCFTVNSEETDPEKIDSDTLIKALEKRLDYLKNTATKGEVLEAIGMVDTGELETDIFL